EWVNHSWEAVAYEKAQVQHNGGNCDGEDDFSEDASVSGKAEPASNLGIKSEVHADGSDDNADSGNNPAQPSISARLRGGSALQATAQVDVVKQ
ncbi:hypothetical protein QP298_14555, partial [Enterococcus faecalis]|uniref:hypothetical protein n=1 Tax=Enterococcus faecalis TaxID=1351 RepID=UPI002550D327